ncbi:MAG: AAA family ATPase [Candidatus Poribacteria bacterium]|nr:AAA family ATPase [Candidatus Poribacteria bacterium]
MVKITKIEIKNFKAFRCPDVIDLSDEGQNLLLYGENGSGKTSLYDALKLFLESSDNNSIKFNQNIFVDKTDKGYIKLYFTPDPKLNKDNYEWSEDVQEHTSVQPIIEASWAKGFLDYKDLLKTNFLHHDKNSVNVFDLLINTLLKHIINEQAVPRRKFSEQWDDILKTVPSNQGATQEAIAFNQQLETFNTGLQDKLNDLEKDANDILIKFGYKNTDMKIELDFEDVTFRPDKPESNSLYPQQILLKVHYLGKDLEDKLAYHRFLNEAKLSAIALSIFFAGFKSQPVSDLRLIVLDDVLIGLDMSHRLSLFNILEEKEWTKYQIILMTYDRTFFEMVKKLKSEDEKWKAAELYCKVVDGHDIPTYVEDKTYLEKAREYLDANDCKACAVYTRSAFEAIIKGFCEKNNIGIKYREDVNELNSNDFWTVIKDRKIILPNSKKRRIIKLALVKKIESAKKFILNPLSHANIVNITKKDLEDAIETVEWLEDALSMIDSRIHTII